MTRQREEVRAAPRQSKELGCCCGRFKKGQILWRFFSFKGKKDESRSVQTVLNVQAGTVQEQGRAVWPIAPGKAIAARILTTVQLPLEAFKLLQHLTQEIPAGPRGSVLRCREELWCVWFLGGELPIGMGAVGLPWNSVLAVTAPQIHSY